MRCARQLHGGIQEWNAESVERMQGLLHALHVPPCLSRERQPAFTRPRPRAEHTQACTHARVYTLPPRKRHHRRGGMHGTHALSLYEQYRANGAKLVHFGLVHSAAVERGALCARSRPSPRRTERPCGAVRCAWSSSQHQPGERTAPARTPRCMALPPRKLTLRRPPLLSRLRVPTRGAPAPEHGERRARGEPRPPCRAR